MNGGPTYDEQRGGTRLRTRQGHTPQGGTRPAHARTRTHTRARRLHVRCIGLVHRSSCDDDNETNGIVSGGGGGGGDRGHGGGCNGAWRSGSGLSKMGVRCTHSSLEVLEAVRVDTSTERRTAGVAIVVTWCCAATSGCSSVAR